MTTTVQDNCPRSTPRFVLAVACLLLACICGCARTLLAATPIVLPGPTMGDAAGDYSGALTAAFGLAAPSLSSEPGLLVTRLQDLKDAPATTKVVTIDKTCNVLHGAALGTELARLKGLESFTDRSDWNWSDQLLPGLSKCTELRVLRFIGMLGGLHRKKGIDALHEMKKLEVIDVSCSGSAISEVLKAAATLPSLRFLRLWGSPDANTPKADMPDYGLFAKMTKVRSLSLLGTTINEPTLTTVSAMPALEELDLAHCDFDSAAFAKLATLAHHLTRLYLRYGKFPDSALFAPAPTGGAAGDPASKDSAGTSLLVTLDLSNTFFGDKTISDAGIASLLSFGSVASLNLELYVPYDEPAAPPPYKGRVTSAGLLKLAGLKTLHSLNLTGHPVNGEVLQSLAGGLPLLESLDLSCCPTAGLDAPALAKLGSLANLSSLDLSRTAIGSDHAAEIAKLGHLTVLSLSKCAKIGDEACSKLTKSTSLQSLDVSEASVTTAGLTSIAKLSQLRALNLSGCTMCAPPAWPSTPKLEVLWLDKSGVTDAGLPTKSKSPKLAALSITKGCAAGLTGAGFARISTLSLLVYLDVSAVKPTHAEASTLGGLPRLAWLVLDGNCLAEGSKPVQKPLNEGAWSSLRRLEVSVRVTFGSGGGDSPMDGLNLPDRLLVALRTRFPAVGIRLIQSLT